jgi:hypothetical protein
MEQEKEDKKGLGFTSNPEAPTFAAIVAFIRLFHKPAKSRATS